MRPRAIWDPAHACGAEYGTGAAAAPSEIPSDGLGIQTAFGTWPTPSSEHGIQTCPKRIRLSRSRNNQHERERLSVPADVGTSRGDGQSLARHAGLTKTCAEPEPCG